MPKLYPHNSAEFSRFTARHAVESVDLLENPEALDSGWWVVVGDSQGELRGWRFAEVEIKDAAAQAQSLTAAQGLAELWSGPALESWRSSLSCNEYVSAVEQVQEQIAAGALQQVNLTRILSADFGEAGEPLAAALHARIAREHPSPYGGYIHVAADSTDVDPVWLVSASPELFLRRSGQRIAATPIKGTAADSSGLAPKDEVESVFVSAEVAAQFARICAPGSVEISAPRIEEHPGLVQLVREVSGDLDPPPGNVWGAIFSHLFPPASVGGFPSGAAREAISGLEVGERGPYCGVFGWVDGDNAEAELAVTIRSFWWGDGQIRFGTGAGITAGSDPQAEWEETELKAAKLLPLASTPATR